MTAAVKFCGITRHEDIVIVNEVRPDYIGFVFAKKSRRYITPEKARRLRYGRDPGTGALDPGIRTVGVFVNESPENVAVLLNDGTADAAQLHGCEDEEYIKKLRSFTDKPIIKAFDTGVPGFEEEVRRCSADYVLIDSASGGEGGTGCVFDWSKAAGIDRPFFLAGGLDAQNVREAVMSCAPYAVDVSSGIETDGVKDPDKMRAFMKAVKAVKEILL